MLVRLSAQVVNVVLGGFRLQHGGPAAAGTIDSVLLVQQPDGSWVPTEVNIYDVVFAGTDYSGVAFDAFAQSVDDSRLVIEYIHEYALPAETIGGGE